MSGIEGIDSRKAIQLARISKLYLSEKNITNLTGEVKTVLKKRKYRILNNEGKVKYYFRDIDILAFRKLETKNGKSILVVNIIRLFDLKDAVNVTGRKVRTNTKNLESKSYSKQVINANIYKLMRAEREIFDDLLAGGPIFRLLQRRYPFSLKKTFLNEGLFLHGEGKFYRIRVSKMLICWDKTSSSESSLVFPYHKESNSYIVQHLDLENLLSYIKAKTTFFETYSGEDFSFSRYEHRRLTVRILLLFWFLLLGTLLFLTSLVKENFIFYLGLGGWLIVGLMSLIFYIRFKKLKKRIVKNINFPYYRRALNFEKLKHFFKIAGATVWFQGQFMFEHKPLGEM